jgi:hypothetical protein
VLDQPTALLPYRWIVPLQYQFDISDSDESPAGIPVTG